MNDNNHGTYETTAKLSFRAFEKLPFVLREAMRQCDYNFATQTYLTYVRKGDDPWLLAKILLEINKEMIGEQAYKTYGIDHPQAVKPTRKKKGD